MPDIANLSVSNIFVYKIYFDQNSGLVKLILVNEFWDDRGSVAVDDIRVTG